MPIIHAAKHALEQGNRPDMERPVAEELPLLGQACWINTWLADMFRNWIRGDRLEHPTRVIDNRQWSALLFAGIESAHTGAAIEVPSFLPHHLEA